MDAYNRLRQTRQYDRPTSLDFINHIVDNFTELHGDRSVGDDHAVVGGVGWIKDLPVTVIGIEKGHSPEERVYRRFGCPVPAGYRKSLRLMKEAEKFHRPIINIVDTQGAYPGVESEKKGIGQAIAENLYECMSLKVPILSIVIGEGGSGGALALGVADEVWMLQKAYYSVITPEACTNILYRDNPKEHLSIVTENLRLFPEDLLQLGVIEKIICESDDFSVNSELDDFWQKITEDIWVKLNELVRMSTSQLVDNRYNKFRKI